jgi:hypothetical protein
MGNFLRMLGRLLPLKTKTTYLPKTIIAIRDRYLPILFLDLNAPGHKRNAAIQELTRH